jgi:hypothetical protein
MLMCARSMYHKIHVIKHMPPMNFGIKLCTIIYSGISISIGAVQNGVHIKTKFKCCFDSATAS